MPENIEGSDSDESPKPPALEIRKLRALYGDPIFPKPRYTITDCLMLLGETRKRFYAKVKTGRYQIRKDGSRSYMLHADLLDAAKGDDVSA